MGSVYHANEETHGRVLAHCKEHGIGVKAFVDAAIQTALKVKAVPVERKAAPPAERKAEESGPKPWELPPFWANRTKTATPAKLPESVEARHNDAEEDDEDESPKAALSSDDVPSVAASYGEPYQPISEMRLLGA